MTFFQANDIFEPFFTYVQYEYDKYKLLELKITVFTETFEQILYDKKCVIDLSFCNF